MIVLPILLIAKALGVSPWAVGFFVLAATLVLLILAIRGSIWSPQILESQIEEGQRARTLAAVDEALGL